MVRAVVDTMMWMVMEVPTARLWVSLNLSKNNRKYTYPLFTHIQVYLNTYFIMLEKSNTKDSFLHLHLSFMQKPPRRSFIMQLKAHREFWNENPLNLRNKKGLQKLNCSASIKFSSLPENLRWNIWKMLQDIHTLK